MNLQIKVYEINKNIDNNTLSSWDSNGTIPLGSWSGENIVAVGGGNFGYQCQFLEAYPGAYLELDCSDITGDIDLYINMAGIINIYLCNESIQTFLTSFYTEDNEFEMKKITVNLDNYTKIKFGSNGGACLNYSFVDFVSLLPMDFPNNLSYSLIDINTIVNIDDIQSTIEDELFSFISNSISIEAIETNNSEYMSLDTMLTSNKLYRIDIQYNNDVKTYNLIYFTDPSLMSKSISEGKTYYNIEMFEIQSYFNVNGWYLGTLQNVYEENEPTNEIESQNYNFFNPGNYTIEELIQSGINDVLKIFIAEYIPINDIIANVSTSSQSISSVLGINAKIADYYYNPLAKTTYILLYNDDYQSIYELKGNGINLVISEIGYNNMIRFNKNFEGDASNPEIMFETYNIHSNGGSYLYGNLHQISTSSDSYWYIYKQWSITNEGLYESETITEIYTNYATLVSSYLPSILPPYTENGDIPGGKYSFDSENTLRMRINSIDASYWQEYYPCSVITNGETNLTCIVNIIEDEIQNYTLIDKTFIDMLKDLSVIQNAFFYFRFSGNDLVLYFRSRGYETAESLKTIDLNKCYSYESTYDYLDYSEFETETFENLISMKRSLLAYYRNFYGNGLEILKLKYKDIIDVNLGDIITVSGKKYIIRDIQEEIGYKMSGSNITKPDMYLELMEVKYLE